MSRRFKPEDINWDADDVYTQHKHNTVEMTVEDVHTLLRYFYIGGGEPDSLNERMERVQEMSQ